VHITYGYAWNASQPYSNETQPKFLILRNTTEKKNILPLSALYFFFTLKRITRLFFKKYPILLPALCSNVFFKKKILLVNHHINLGIPRNTTIRLGGFQPQNFEKKIQTSFKLGSNFSIVILFHVFFISLLIPYIVLFIYFFLKKTLVWRTVPKIKNLF
jgi:hypothetical protein